MWLCVCLCVCVTPTLSRLSPSLKPTLASHFQNATVGFLQPIEDPITISFAALLFAHNDRQNVSLVCPRLLSPPLCSLSPSSSPSLYLDPLSPALSRSVSFSHSLPPSRTSVSVRNERGGKLQDCVYFSRIIEIRLDANGRSCPPKCLSISRAHTRAHTQICMWIQAKGIRWAQRLVCPSVCVCLSGCV